MLHAFSGIWLPEQHLAVDSPLTTRTYGGDKSRTKTYNFNSLGFRGEELDSNAKAHIFVFGCSHTVGVGVNEDEIWHHAFKRRFAEKNGYQLEQVNLLNFSTCGASNDFVSRTLITQCTAVKPDLVLVEFAEKNRTESHRSGHPLPIGPWMWRNGLVRLMGTIKKSWNRMQFARDFHSHLHTVDRYYRYYSDEVGFLNAVRNILLVQYFCQAQQLDCIISWEEHQLLKDAKYLSNPCFSQLIALVDQTRFCGASISDPDIRVDVAADGSHAGPQSHDNFASKMIEFYERSTSGLPSMFTPS